MYPDRRQAGRFNYSRPVQLSFGIQVVVNGRIRNISQQSAFIDMKNSIFVERNDEFSFKISVSMEAPDISIDGKARITRVDDEGIAICFTKIDNENAEKLENLIEELKPAQKRKYY